eukprot:7378409-Karenia_brevis.AAC.1
MGRVEDCSSSFDFAPPCCLMLGLILSGCWPGLNLVHGLRACSDTAQACTGQSKSSSSSSSSHHPNITSC